MSTEKYSDARKQMELLIREEAAASPEKGGRGMVPKNELARKTQKRPQTKKGNWMQSDELGTNIPGKSGGTDGGVLDESEAGTWVGGGQTAAYDQELEVTSEAEMMRTLTEKVGLPYADIGDFDLTTDQAEQIRGFIPASVARERRIFPLKETAAAGARPLLTVGISDPLDITIVDDLRLLLPEHDIEAVVLPEEDIVDAIDRHYGVGDVTLDNVIEELGEEMGKGEKMGPSGQQIDIDPEALANSPPVIKLVNLLLITAVQDRASDIHIEPFAGTLRMRYRVDGVLREIPSPPKSLQIGLISRIKVMATMNIAETRAPQDGRIRLNIGDKEIDLRVASVPTVHGESIVMRVLDKSTMMIGIRQLGFQEEVLEEVLVESKRPNGILLVTGPTGSGKTTSLYSLLGEIFDSGLKFITTEDPVEYELPGIVQVNINPRVNLTFAACLRAILRQDPDVILVGEIRDVETAQISIQAALTGHMVFSTLHTNSAAATVTRLIDMGLEPFLLTSTLRAIIGQRLVRTVCPNCKEPVMPADEELEDFGVDHSQVEDITFFQGRGCDYCNFSGYKGRLGIYEFLRITEEINELILQRAATDEIHALSVHQGMQTMRSDGWLKVCLGVTTFDEVSKQTPRETEETVRQEMALAKRSLEKIEHARQAREDEENAEFEEEGDDDFGLPTVVTDSEDQQNQ